MISSLLIFLGHVIPRKNMFHACAVENFGGVVQVPLMADFCYFAREQTLYKTCI